MARARTILVVDDDPECVQRARAVLEAEGFRVTTARDGDEALAKLRDAPPDLVLLDIIMPKRNGFQVCRALRAEPALQALPVLFVSVKSQPSDRFWAQRVGADGFVAKPYDPAELVREVTALLQRADATTS
jgi:twitching motility two-component system response regulator PilH